MLLFTLNVLCVALASAACYEPNEAHPPPNYDANDPVLQDAFAFITQSLKTAVNEPDSLATSFSVEVTSSKESLWSLHHTALRRNLSRPDIPEVNGDALYRIASITKAFTVLGILYQHEAGNLSLDDPVDRYLEGLSGKQRGSIPWKDITLRTLASQLSGIPRDFAQQDLLNSNPEFGVGFNPWDLGLPPISREGLPECDEFGENYSPPCGRKDLLKSVTSKPPLFAPKQKSTYSNLAFELLGLVIANVTGKTYEDYIHDAIFKPLDMSKSTLSKPPDSAGVIPINPQYWYVDEGIQNPTGGIYSSSTDLSKFLRYVLTHYNGITPALNWMHAVSPSEGLNSFYGTPWEIFRTDKALLKSRRAITFNAKSGGLPGYTSIIVTVPQYDIGITILVAGPSQAFLQIFDTVAVEVVRAAEEVAIRQLQQRYAGTYVSGDPNLNSSLTLTADHRGLVVEEFISNSTDVLNSPLLPAAGAPSDKPWFLQLTPTLLYRNETEQEGERWRFYIAEERLEGEGKVLDDFCAANVDMASYGGQPINEIVFWRSEGNVFKSAELSAFRVTLSRHDSDKHAHLSDEQGILEL
ncbi:beta-lactamase/transpeptidase-like protein [Lophiostoma macrostomum CBS 122681]|uniref:Beta-lactamase/transpeptidase-like protein n=1 Tax=Lophiostoma macrostomum CBS 122681 TaxID=1314788 RepID=A0A6A6TMV6_9PLEO|nr:beta-lactamase/transpeptidase-like protein [Lophiostoma macrostomum CBS 122681]